MSTTFIDYPSVSVFLLWVFDVFGESFVKYFQDEKGSSAASIHAYLSDFKIFCDYCESQKNQISLSADIEPPFWKYLGDCFFESGYKPDTKETLMSIQKDLKEERELKRTTGGSYRFPSVQLSSMVRDYALYLKGAKKSQPRTVSRKLSSLRTFFKYLAGRNYFHTNPLNEIKNPKLPQRLPTYIEEDNLEHLYDELEKGSRNHAIINLFINTGMRLSELSNLDVSDMKFSDQTGNYVTVVGKGDVERKIPLNASITEIMKDYIASNELENGPLFVSKRGGGKMSVRAIQHLVNVYRIKIGMEKGELRPHVFRHTFATQLHAKDVSTTNIQQLLGHKNLNTTQIYVHTSSKQLQDAVQKLDHK